MTPNISGTISCPDLAIGVDPGSRISGIGIVANQQGRLSYVDHFPIRMPEKFSHAEKLAFFADHFQNVLDRFHSGTLVIESLFTAKNINSILKLSHVRGVAMMLAAKKGWPVVEIAPASVKVSVTGYGRATKEQVQFMIQKILKLPAPPEPADCADALALAVCHLGKTRWNRKLKGIA